jgi:hypothetical protein
MAQTKHVYDPDDDKSLGRHNISDDESSHSKQSDLRNAEESGSLFNANGDGPDDGQESKNTSDGREAGSFYNPDGSSGYIDRFRSKFGSLPSNRWVVGSLIGGSAGIVILLIILVLLAGSLKIPNLAQHIAEYQFARVMRQSTETSEKITYEKLALDTVDDSAFSRYKATYQGLRENTWGKLDKYRPAKVISNMQGDGRLGLKYDDPTITGRVRLKAVTLGDKDYPVKQLGYTRYVPGISDMIEFKNNTAFARDFAPALAESLKADQVGPIVRGQVARQIRKELGINLIAWSVGKYAGKTESEARLVQERDAHRAIAGKEVTPSVTPGIQDAEEDVKNTHDANIQDDAKLQQIIDDSGVDKEAVAVIDKHVSSGVFTTAVGVLNPTFSIALGGCTIYDGSLTQSGPTIESQSASQQRAFYYVASAADQQKYGQTNGEAVGAMNAKLGDITQANPEVRASGGTVDTSSNISSEGSAGGDLSVVDAVFGSTIGKIVDTVAGPTCSTLLNPAVAIGGAVLGPIVAIFSGGSTGAIQAVLDEGVTAAASRVTTRLVENIVKKFADKEATKATIGTVNAKARAVIGDNAKSAAKLAGLTVLAKLIVMSKANQFNDGLEQGVDYANMADSGGNIAANEIEQRQYYGRPLTQSEAGENHATDLAYVNKQNSEKPLFDRYLATSNPDSLLSRTATLTASTLNMSMFHSLATMSSKIFTPLNGSSHVFANIFMPKTMAATAYSAVVDDYGNVQFGYSPKEMNLLRTDFSFRLLENQKVVEDSGKLDEIESTFGKCFDGSMKLGDMLAEGLIVRDKDGNIDPDKGDCAPNKLSSDNNAYDVPSEFGSHMVFRWRVYHNYKNGLDHLLDQQEETATPSSTAGNSTGSTNSTSGTTVSGDAQDLAKKLLELAKKGKVKFNVLNSRDINDGSTPAANIKDTADGKPARTTSNCSGRGAQPPVDSVNLDENLLKFLVDLAGEENIQINAIAGQCHSVSTSNHYKGRAVDFECPLDVAAADRIGTKYGVSRNSENCSNAAHYHYSVGGN